MGAVDLSVAPGSPVPSPEPTAGSAAAGMIEAAVGDHPEARRNFGYQPALDGLRGVAVSLVLVFHAGFSWMTGGYVGVSVFFTLSGYLITSLALHEWQRSGRVDVVAFYSRRVRRLLPASLICIAGVVVAAHLGAFDGITNVRRDMWAAVAQMYNWVALAGGEDYATQMARVAGQRAPLDHYWSLAIEEQFYWIWPLALLVVLRARPARRIGVVAALATAFTISTIIIAAVAGDGATYLATPARLPEILSGALLAVVLFHRRPGASVRSGRGAPALALAGLAVIGWAAITWPARSGPAYDGWLPAFSLASVAVIAGLQVPSPVRAALSWGPLVALGRISYGVYLFHWPVFTLVDERLIDTSRVVLFGVRLAVTITIAVVSFRVLEMPIRRGRGIGYGRGAAAWRRTFDVAGASCIAVAIVVASVPDRDGSYTYVADETVAAVAIPPVAPDAVLPPVSRRAVRVMVVGDSTAYALGSGMIQYAFDHPGQMQVSSAAAVGCGLNMTGELPDSQFRDACLEVNRGLVGSVERLRPDVVVAMVTMSDIEDRRWSDAEGLLAITDPRFADRLFDAYALLTAAFVGAGAGDVVWVMPPIPRFYAVGEGAWAVDPERFAAYRRVLDRLAAWSDRAAVADVPAWIDERGERPDTDDGLHWTLDGAIDVTEEFLGPLIREVAEAREATESPTAPSPSSG